MVKSKLPLVKKLSIIIPSYNDKRIISAIKSVRNIDDINTVKIIIIDGGSEEILLGQVRALLGEEDLLISEKDKGIFDALNKGLEVVKTDFLGWLGSDDLFTGKIKTSVIVKELHDYDLYISDLLMVKGSNIIRRTSSWPCSVGLCLLGLHNPHYSTFGRSTLLKKYRFDLDLYGADIKFFLRIFRLKPRVKRTATVGVLQEVGGYSNLDYKHILKINLQLFKVYKNYLPAFLAWVPILIKLLYKMYGSLRYKIWPSSVGNNK